MIAGAELHLAQPPQGIGVLAAHVLPVHAVVQGGGLGVLVAQAAGLGLLPLQHHAAGFALQRFTIEARRAVLVAAGDGGIAPGDPLGEPLAEQGRGQEQQEEQRAARGHS